MASSEIKMSMSLATAKVTTALGNLKTKIGSFASSANEKLGNLAKMVSVGLAAAFVGLTKKAIDLGSELSDIAISTGFATEKFQVFRGALIDAGGKAGAMEKAIIIMQKAVVQGSEGLTTYTRAFDRLGLSVDDLKRMSPEDQFEMIGKAIAGAEDQQEAFTSALEIFGTKNAPRLIEVFKRLDKDGYGKMAKDIEAAYGIMDAETQKSLDKAADTIERFKVKATIKVGDLISGESNHAAFKILGARFGALMAKVGEMMANAMIYGVKALSAGMSASVTVFKTRMTTLFKMVGPSLKLAIGEAINPLIKVLDMVFRTKTPLIDVEQAKIDLITLSTTAQKSFGEVFDSNMEGMKDWRVSTKKQQDAYNELADTLQSNLDSSRAIAKVTKEEVPVVKKITESMKLQSELKEAIQRGDLEAVKIIEDALKLEQQILKVMKDHNVTREEATAHVNALAEKEQSLADEKNAQAAKEEAQAQKMINMERELLNAVLSGDDIAARAAQKKIDLELRAMEIMEQLKVSYEEAYAIAQKLARIEAGPDLNDSGFTTRFEQREFNRQQKQRDKALDNARKQEERDQREQGGWIPNVSKERRKTDFGKVNMLKRKDETARRAENKKIGNMVRGGMDRAEAEAQFAAARAQRARGIDEARAAQKKFGIQDPKIKAKEEADAKAKADWEKEFDDMKDKGGLGPDGKQPGPDGKQPGPDGKQPEPKKPDQAIAEGLQAQAGKLDEQIAILTEISASLKC